jgi:hypothetical protein
LKIRGLLNPSPLHSIQMILFILIELLLVFDVTFAKFHLIGPLHLYDALLFLLGLTSIYFFFTNPNKTWNWPIIIILALSLVYAAYSYANGHPTNYLIRQYALFIYLGLAFIIFNSFINPKFNNLNIRFIILIAFASIGIQLVYLVYKFFTIDGFSLFGEFNYYSKMVIVGVIVFAAYILVYTNKLLPKTIISIGVLAFSTTLGHASAFLAVFGIIAVYLILLLPNWVKLAGGLISALIVIGFILYLPQFNDTNAEWRIIFWKYSMKEILLNYYGILGHGFGVPYTNQEILDALRTQANSPWFEVRPEETYLSPMHNSFITMAFHIGLLPSLLIFVPLYTSTKEVVFSNTKPQDKTQNFLFLSLIGLFIWSSFNVVLELPHSSMFVWLVYFTLIYYTYKKSNSE